MKKYKSKGLQKAQQTLEEAVMSVLIEYKNGCSVSQISKFTGLYREKGKAGINDAIVIGLLNKLHKDNRVERVGENKKNKKWRRTGS